MSVSMYLIFHQVLGVYVCGLYLQRDCAEKCLIFLHCFSVHYLVLLYTSSLIFFMRFTLSLFSLALLFSFAPFSMAQENTFTDLPADHYAYEAVMFLRSEGVISGYDNGTFRPDNPVNRAEALKIIVSPLVTDEQVEQAKLAKTVYSDIKNDDWYKPYVELARASGIVDGPPKKEKFNGGNSVIKVEFKWYKKLSGQTLNHHLLKSSYLFLKMLRIQMNGTTHTCDTGSHHQ